VLFSQVFTEQEGTKSIVCSLQAVIFVSYFTYIRFLLLTHYITDKQLEASWAFLLASLLFSNCQSSLAHEQPPKRTDRVWKRFTVPLVYDSKEWGWLSWGGCSAEHKSASQREGEIGSCVRMTGMLSTTGNSHNSEDIIIQG